MLIVPAMPLNDAHFGRFSLFIQPGGVMHELSKSFVQVAQMIQVARSKAFLAVNTALIELYWDIGQYLCERIAGEQWGKGVIKELASYIARTEPTAKGFTDKNLWRMKQFYETYSGSEILATPWRQSSPSENLTTAGRVLAFEDSLLARVSWSHHRLIFGQCKTQEECAFYIRMTIQEGYSVRELERQLNSSLFERAVLSKPIFTPSAVSLPSDIYSGLKDNYVFEFLQLSEPHSEYDLQKAILANIRNFLLEFSRDFAFLGKEFTLQVGNKDFSVDLLFFNRALNCLVAIELKVVDFMPEFLGKLNFYLEALDRDVKKPHENPSIGILLCKAKDDEVVEYAMSRQLSPAMVAQYHLQLPDKELLQAKLHEFFEQNEQKFD
jgi:predicted nuclease of restriction endonuclease-like (RecB) superfamily